MVSGLSLGCVLEIDIGYDLGRSIVHPQSVIQKAAERREVVIAAFLRLVRHP